MAADESAPHRNRLSTKNTPNVIPGTKKEVINILVFQYMPLITVIMSYMNQCLGLKLDQ